MFGTPERRAAADSGRVHCWVSGDSWEATAWREGGASQGPAAYSSGNGDNEIGDGGNDSNESQEPAQRISSQGESSLSFTLAWASLSGWALRGA